MTPMQSANRARPRIEIRPVKNGISSAGGEHPFMVRIVPPSLEATGERPPLNLAIVLDRSGSMGGQPIEHAKRAASHLVGLLRPNDRIAVVVYDHIIDVIVPSTPVHDPEAIRRRIDAIHARGSTNLHAGWLEGATQVANWMDDGTLNRVILLSDGCANQGVIDLAAITNDVARLRDRGVSTSALGLGRHFNEDLMLGMADAGAGNFYFVESVDDLETIFTAELSGATATVGRNATLEFEPENTDVALADVLNDFERVQGRMKLPNLVSGLDVEVGLVLRVPELDVGDARLGTVRLTWTDMDGETLEIDRPIRIPVLSSDAYEAASEDLEVASLVAELKEARAKERAKDALDAGDKIRARRIMADSRTRLNQMPQTDRIRQELLDLDRIDAAMDAGDVVVTRKRIMAQADRKRKSFYHERIGAGSSGALQTIEVTRRDGATGRIELVVGDITDETVDAILNPTNTRLYGTGKTVDGAVHRKGGMELTRACREIGYVDLGDSVVTEGFGLPAKYVLHTAVPEWGDDEGKARKLLWSCYRTALDLVERMSLRTLAVPAVGAGSNRFPPDIAAETAVSTIRDQLERSRTLEMVRIVLFDQNLVPVYRNALRMVGNSVA